MSGFGRSNVAAGLLHRELGVAPSGQHSKSCDRLLSSVAFTASCAAQIHLPQYCQLSGVSEGLPLVAKYNQNPDFKQLLAVAGEEGFVTIVDTTNLSRLASDLADRTWRPRANWVCHNNAIFDLAWAKDDAVIYTASGHNIQQVGIWDTSTATATAYAGGHNGSIKSISVSTLCEDIFATGARDGNIALFDARSPGAGHGVAGHSQSVPALSPVWVQHKAHTPHDKQATATTVTSVAFVPQSYLLLSAGAQDTCVKLWDLRLPGLPLCDLDVAMLTPPAARGGRQPASTGTGRRSAGKATATKGAVAGGSIGNGRSRLEEHFLCPTATSAGGITSIAISPSGSQVLVTCLDSYSHLYDLSLLHAGPRATLQPPPPVYKSSFYVRNAFSPCGRYVMAAANKGANIWRLSNPELPCISLEDESEMYGVAWCGMDASQVASCGGDGCVKIWQLSKAAPMAEAERGMAEQRWLPSSVGLSHADKVSGQRASMPPPTPAFAQAPAGPRATPGSGTAKKQFVQKRLVLKPLVAATPGAPAGVQKASAGCSNPTHEGAGSGEQQLSQAKAAQPVGSQPLQAFAVQGASAYAAQAEAELGLSSHARITLDGGMSPARPAASLPASRQAPPGTPAASTLPEPLLQPMRNSPLMSPRSGAGFQRTRSRLGMSPSDSAQSSGTSGSSGGGAPTRSGQAHALPQGIIPCLLRSPAGISPRQPGLSHAKPSPQATACGGHSPGWGAARPAPSYSTGRHGSAQRRLYASTAEQDYGNVAQQMTGSSGAQLVASSGNSAGRADTALASLHRMLQGGASTAVGSVQELHDGGWAGLSALALPGVSPRAGAGAAIASIMGGSPRSIAYNIADGAPVAAALAHREAHPDDDNPFDIGQGDDDQQQQHGRSANLPRWRSSEEGSTGAVHTRSAVATASGRHTAFDEHGMDDIAPTVVATAGHAFDSDDDDLSSNFDDEFDDKENSPPMEEEDLELQGALPDPVPSSPLPVRSVSRTTGAERVHGSQAAAAGVPDAGGWDGDGPADANEDGDGHVPGLSFEARMTLLLAPEDATGPNAPRRSSCGQAEDQVPDAAAEAPQVCRVQADGAPRLMRYRSCASFDGAGEDDYGRGALAPAAGRANAAVDPMDVDHDGEGQMPTGLQSPLCEHQVRQQHCGPAPSASHSNRTAGTCGAALCHAENPTPTKRTRTSYDQEDCSPGCSREGGAMTSCTGEGAEPLQHCANEATSPPRVCSARNAMQRADGLADDQQPLELEELRSAAKSALEAARSRPAGPSALALAAASPQRKRGTASRTGHEHATSMAQYREQQVADAAHMQSPFGYGMMEPEAAAVGEGAVELQREEPGEAQERCARHLRGLSGELTTQCSMRSLLDAFEQQDQEQGVHSTPAGQQQQNLEYMNDVHSCHASTGMGAVLAAAHTSAALVGAAALPAASQQRSPRLAAAPISREAVSNYQGRINHGAPAVGALTTAEEALHATRGRAQGAEAADVGGGNRQDAAWAGFAVEGSSENVGSPAPVGSCLVAPNPSMGCEASNDVPSPAGAYYAVPVWQQAAQHHAAPRGQLRVEIIPEPAVSSSGRLARPVPAPHGEQRPAAGPARSALPFPELHAAVDAGRGTSRPAAVQHGQAGRPREPKQQTLLQCWLAGTGGRTAGGEVGGGKPQRGQQVQGADADMPVPRYMR